MLLAKQIKELNQEIEACSKFIEFVNSKKTANTDQSNRLLSKYLIRKIQAQVQLDEKRSLLKAELQFFNSALKGAVHEAQDGIPVLTDVLYLFKLRDRKFVCTAVSTNHAFSQAASHVEEHNLCSEEYSFVPCTDGINVYTLSVSL
jgi:hypothetical protein